MDTITILGNNRCAEHTRFREACRGVIIRDNEILMSYAAKEDLWMIPGGGVEAGETLQDCCVRELAEEAGLNVEPLRLALTIDEYYGKWLYRSHYFICRTTGTTRNHLTDDEIAAGLESRWISLQEALSIFAGHENGDYEEMKRGAYLREYRALTTMIKEGLL